MVLPSLSSARAICSLVRFFVSSFIIMANKLAQPALERLFCSSRRPPFKEILIVTVGISLVSTPINCIPFGNVFFQKGGTFITGFGPEGGTRALSKWSVGFVYAKPLYP